MNGIGVSVRIKLSRSISDDVMVGVDLWVSNTNRKRMALFTRLFPDASCTEDSRRCNDTKPSAPALVILKVYVSPEPLREPGSIEEIPAVVLSTNISDSSSPCTDSLKTSVK